MAIHLEVPGEKPASSQDSHIEDTSESRNESAPAHRASIAAERARRHLNARLANPLQGYTYNELQKMGRTYAHDNALTGPDDVRAFEIGACLAREPTYLKHATRLGSTDEELAVLEHELSHRWAQPRLLYLVVALCSVCAAVQGMGMLGSITCKNYTYVTTDETVVNGAQLFYAHQFGIGGDDYRSTWLVGLYETPLNEVATS
jgi:hypothetical protein